MKTKIDSIQMKELLKYNSFKIKSVPDISYPKELPTEIRDEDKNDIEKCFRYWQSLQNVRDERERNIRYRNGDQWSDMILDTQTRNRYIKEEQYLCETGKTPLKHNFVHLFIRNLTGQFISNPSQTIVFARSEDEASLGDMLTNTLQSCHYLNKTDKLDVLLLEELLLGGLACVKVRYDYWPNKNKCDGKIELVNTNRLFFNTDIEDPRMFDIRLIGQLHDYTIDELISNFSNGKKDQQRIYEIFNINDSVSHSDIFLSEDKHDFSSFHICNDQSKYRVIELWQRKGKWINHLHDYADASEQNSDMPLSEIEKINDERIKIGMELGAEKEDIPLIHVMHKYEYYWSVKYMTADGVCLYETETPYKHEEHPYILSAVTLLNGEIKSVINDLIDIQRYVNRLIVMIDFIMGASAKGVLMVPESAIPDGCSIDDFASEYVKANGVILYKSGPGRETPFQISTNSTNIGAWDMLQLQMNLIQQISGVSGAIQGERPPSGTPASLYAQQTHNSQLNYRQVMETLKQMQLDRDDKLLKVLMQYYDDIKHINISGKSYSDTAEYYDPLMAEKISDFNMVVSQSSDSPVFRSRMDEMLFSLLNSGFINLELYLRNSSLPFAEKMLNQIEEMGDALLKKGGMSQEDLVNLSKNLEDMPQDRGSENLKQQFLSTNRQ